MKPRKAPKNLRKSTLKVSSPSQVQVDWQKQPVSLSSSQPPAVHNTKSMQLQKLLQQRCWWSQNCCKLLGETKKKVICTQEQLFYLRTVTVHFAAQQETQCGWQPRPTNLIRGFKQVSFTSCCNSPQAQHKVTHCTWLKVLSLPNQRWQLLFKNCSSWRLLPSISLLLLEVHMVFCKQSDSYFSATGVLFS